MHWIYVIMNYSVALMELTVEDIKDIVRSKMIDHQQIRIVNLCKHFEYSEGCKIGDIGCKHLSEVNWPNLRELNLSK